MLFFQVFGNFWEEMVYSFHQMIILKKTELNGKHETHYWVSLQRDSQIQIVQT